MQEVNVGIVGLGNVGSSTLAILSENGDQIALKLGYRLKVVAVCSRSVHTKQIPAGLGDVFKTTDWREVVAHPDVQIVAELVGGTSVAAEIVNAAIAYHKSVVTANKELMAACGPEIWDRAIQAGINLAMEASRSAAASPSTPSCARASRATAYRPCTGFSTAPATTSSPRSKRPAPPWRP